MFYINFIYIFVFGVLAVHQGVTGQKYYGRCDVSDCRNLTCVHLYHNETTHYCLPLCTAENSTSEKDCLSSLTCSQRNCHNGTMCKSYVGYSVCQCQMGFGGDQCQTDISVPCPSRCHNLTQSCTQELGQDVICHCDKERAGENCNTYLCQQGVIPCGAEGTCESLTDDDVLGYRCICNPGYTGESCLTDINECASDPCQNNATCLDLKNSFICNCTGNWTDRLCDIPIEDASRAICIHNDCMYKGNNGMCDRECDDIACNFDNTECLYGVDNPWKICPAGDKYCMEKFNDGTCDNDCNSEQCLYDGFDCLPPVNCENELCYKTINDGNCDANCNTSACFYDGNDCNDNMAAVNSSSLGTLIIKFSNYPNQTETRALEMFNFLAQKIGVSTRAALHIRRRSENMMYYKGNNMWSVYYDIENIYSCDNKSHSCWTNLESYRRTLAAYLRSNEIMKLPGNITSVTVNMCQEGQYDEMCNRNCSVGCQQNSCSSETGNCNCKSGYYGLQCTLLEACRNCKNDNCDNGLCVNGCKQGYKGTYCNETCNNGTYGDMCRMNCSSNCVYPCDKMNGTCMHGCKSGYIGAKCDMPCPRGKYGIHCNMNCSGNCVHNDACNYTTGYCNRGCKSGWKNKKCDTVCPDGKYGQGCTNTCGQCVTTCSKSTGDCDKCKEGWKGKACNLKASKAQQPNKSSVNVIVPVIVVVIVIVLIVLLIAIFCVWKRTQKDGYSVDEKDTEMNPIFKQRNPSTAENPPDTAALLTTSPNTDIDLDDEKMTADNEDAVVNSVVNIEDEKGGVYVGDDNPTSNPVTNRELINVQDGVQTSGVVAAVADDKRESMSGEQRKPEDSENADNKTEDSETNNKEDDKTEEKVDNEESAKVGDETENKEKDDAEKSDKERKSSSSSDSSSSSNSSNDDNEKHADDKHDDDKPPDSAKENRPLSDTHSTVTGDDGVLHTPI